MSRLALILTLALATSACASTKADKPPVCDGKNRRPANPHGSVLSPAATPPAAQPAAAPKAAAGPQSSLGRSQGGCA
jgi:hypothetical protein